MPNAFSKNFEKNVDYVSPERQGYLKCDISVITKGDAVKIPPKSERDEDDIEA